MEQGVLTFLKETDYTMAGRKVELVIGDTGGAPAGAKTKAQELVERDNVDVILGPLAAFELYAINDYIQQQKMPTLSMAAADNLTQRQPNPFLIARLGDVIAGPAADGTLCGDRDEAQARGDDRSRILPSTMRRWAASRRRSSKEGGCVVNKLWPPLVTPDYTPYIAQIARLRRRLPGLCRLEPAALHEGLCGMPD